MGGGSAIMSSVAHSKGADEVRQIAVNQNEASIVTTSDEILILLAALREADQELQDWEFETRTGVERREFAAVARSLRDVHVAMVGE